MAGIALRGGTDVRAVLASGLGAVMAVRAFAGNVDMIEGGRFPRGGSVASVTLRIGGDM